MVRAQIDHGCHALRPVDKMRLHELIHHLDLTIGQGAVASPCRLNVHQLTEPGENPPDAMVEEVTRKPMQLAFMPKGSHDGRQQGITVDPRCG